MTLFLRVLEVPIDKKAEALRCAVRDLRDLSTPIQDTRYSVFNRPLDAFRSIPGNPFAYWLGATLMAAFASGVPLAKSGFTSKCGLGTLDDFRFLRCWWEVSASTHWMPLIRGTTSSPWHGDVALCVAWKNAGRELKQFVEDKVGSATRKIQAQDFYGRPGLTWSRRPHRRGAFRVGPSGAHFADNGPMLFREQKDLLLVAALLNSSTANALMQAMMSRGQGDSGQTLTYEVGVIDALPLPTKGLPSTWSRLTTRAWSLARSLASRDETSHAFDLPLAIDARAMVLGPIAIFQELTLLQREIDEVAFELYGISTEDRAAIEMSFDHGAVVDPASHDAGDLGSDDGANDDEPSVEATTDALASWLVGVAFARFDPRLATGDRAMPPEPEPFDPLPSRSPGMWPEGEEPAQRPDILVYDEGHSDDLTARALAVAERVGIDAPENLRAWLGKEFFPLHIKMYSKSRRKAPIYWQLATPSASYSVWLYIHAFSKDTLFRVQNDYVAPKLAHEERRLETLSGELRDNATAAQRRELAEQEAFVDELRAFLEEVKRIAPIWKPNLDDGVIINFAPLWRLVPQNRAWQKELKSTWDALCGGKYDWAHLAMHLWPERAVPKCAGDRSLAIAHGLEDAFWVEGTDGRWTARRTPARSINELIGERTSLTVKSALKSFLEAPVATGNGGRGRRGRGRSAAAIEREGA